MTAPKLWPVVSLGDLLTDIQPGFASGKHNSEGVGIAHLRPMNISTFGKIDRAIQKFVDPSLADRPARLLKKGDVLFNNTNSPELVGKTALFADDDQPAFSNHMTRLRVDASVMDPGFLALRLHQAWREGWFAAHCNNHVSQASIGRDVLQRFEIELPPLEAQRAIYKMSQLANEIQTSCSSHVARSKRAIERFRQAVLASAFSGRLTEEWRAARGQVSGTASEYLRCLLEARMDSVNKQTLEPFITPDLPEIPEEWRWASADALTTLITKGTTPRATDMHQGRGEIPFLKVYNLTFDGTVDFTINPTFIPADVHNGPLKRSRVFPGDLLINIVGPPLGKVGVVPEGYGEWNINQAIAVLRPVTEINVDFLKLWLLSPSLQSHYTHRAKATAGQYNLTLQICRELPVPIPVPEEQAEIVRRVEELFKISEETLARVNLASSLLERADCAVVAKAFRGELVQ